MTSIKALIIHPTDPRRTSLTEIEASSAKDLQRIVGGWIEAVYGRCGDPSCTSEPCMTIYLNEEGKLHGLEPNWAATILWQLYTNPQDRNDDVIVGTVVVTGGNDAAGNTLPIADHVLKAAGLIYQLQAALAVRT